MGAGCGEGEVLDVIYKHIVVIYNNVAEKHLANYEKIDKMSFKVLIFLEKYITIYVGYFFNFRKTLYSENYKVKGR